MEALSGQLDIGLDFRGRIQVGDATSWWPVCGLGWSSESFRKGSLQIMVTVLLGDKEEEGQIGGLGLSLEHLNGAGAHHKGI